MSNKKNIYRIAYYRLAAIKTQNLMFNIYIFIVMTESCHVKHPSRGHDRSSGGNNIKKGKEVGISSGVLDMLKPQHHLQERAEIRTLPDRSDKSTEFNTFSHCIVHTHPYQNYKYKLM